MHIQLLKYFFKKWQLWCPSKILNIDDLSNFTDNKKIATINLNLFEIKQCISYGNNSFGNIKYNLISWN